VLESRHFQTVIPCPHRTGTVTPQLESPMNMKITACRPASLGALTLVAIAMFAPGVALAVDATAAQALARQNNCFKCHAVDKKKEGPAWKEVAAKLKSDKDAEAKLYTHLTTGPKVKFEDGHQEDHPIIKAKTPEDTKNLVQWILSLQ
jgi:cytochrome c